MHSRIPLPGADNPQFKDVMDFWEQLQQRKQKQPLMEAQARAANALASRDEKLSQMPFAGRQIPGAAGKAMALMQVKAKYGEDSPEYQESKRLYDLDIARDQQIIAYQQSLMDTQGKRFSTPEGRRAQEESEIDKGVMPGTSVGGRTGQPLTPEQQEKLKGQYNLKQLKDATDTSVRQRILFSKNMEKTLGNLNVDDLVSYSGVQGAGELLKDKASALRGNITPRYQRYKESLTAADTLAKQVRQFYGDSITPEIQKGLKKLTNPNDWLEHPKVAKARFNAFKRILQTESKTFTDAAKNAKIFEEEPTKNELNYNIQTGEFE